MSAVRNILFIMCDQLRGDYLSCASHPFLATPAIDALAARGVRFRNAFVQSPVCGPSRMSFYTGRYVTSHRAIWNFVPLPIGELTLGDYLRPFGLRVALIGKTHMAADEEGMRRLGISPESERGKLIAEGGFEPIDRDDGIHPPGMPAGGSRYMAYLRERGYEGDNPWHDFANSAAGANGEILSGWSLRHARHPARVQEQDSETAYMTRRAMDFINEQGDRPWCLHLSYIKPHWPYMAPAPYHELYGPEHVIPAKRSDRELVDPHPVYDAFTRHRESIAFAREEVRRTVVPTYMGLVAQIDHHLGRLFSMLEHSGRMEDTMIVFTSDHGDYLGDHHLGEKELFHDVACRVPVIFFDPDPRADATRGSVDQRLVEAIDLLPSFVDALGGVAPAHIVEGRSLLPLLRDARPGAWRQAVFSEFDFSFRAATRERLGCDLDRCRILMLRTERWKYVSYDGFRPQLFDLESDPDEFVDLGARPELASVRDALERQLFDWLRRRKSHVTVSNAFVAGWSARAAKIGIEIGRW
jgi:arylsulfatase A-like enzyme